MCKVFCPLPQAHCTHFRSVRRTHPHPSFWAHTHTHSRIFFSKKNKICYRMRTCARSSAPCAHVCTLKTIYARTHTHISENFPAPICTKITALKVCKNHSMSSQRTFFVNEYFWLHYSNKHKIMDCKIYLHFRVAFGVIWLNLLKYFLPIQQRKCPTTSLVFSCRVSFSSF